MSVYEPGGRAHDSDPPSGSTRPTMMNVDKSGVSMSWKTAAAIIAAIVVGMLTANTFIASLARSSDLAAHDRASSAHPSHPKHAEVDEMIKPLQAKVDETSTAVITVQNGYYDQRAEDLAYRAVEKMPRRTPTRHRIERFKQVKAHAKANLKAEVDIRTGIDGPLF